MIRQSISLSAAVALTGLLAGPGCSISASSESISNSISSPFEWSKSSSDSSSGGDAGSSGGSDSHEPEVTPEPEQSRDAYSRDVTELAAAFGSSGGDIDAFRSGISQLAAERGVTNWEVDPLTCESIGRGLRQAGADPQEFGSFAYELFGSDDAKRSALQAGYRGTGR